MSKKNLEALLTNSKAKAFDSLVKQIEKLCPGDKFGYIDACDAYVDDFDPAYLADFGKKNALAMLLHLICSDLCTYADNYDIDEIFTLAEYIDSIAWEVENE